MIRRSRTIQNARPTPNTGHHNTHHSRHSTGPPHKQKGTPTFNGRVTIDTPALHSPGHPTSSCHPTIHDGTPSTTTRGRCGRRIPHRTNTTDRHTPPHHRPTGNSARHDCSASEYCAGIGQDVDWTTPPGRPAVAHTTAIQQQHTRGETDTIHSPPLTRSRSHNQRTIMINDDQ